jgi:hypothetical protein
VVLSP